MREIRLTTGSLALVDDEDFEWLTALGRWTLAGCGPYPTLIGPTPQTMHQIIMGRPPVEGMVVDHINLNKLDNRRSNLRFCTEHESRGNVAVQARKTSSRFKGVFRTSGSTTWRVQINEHGKTRYLGVFDSEEDAARAYDAAARAYWGEFAWLNFPDENKVVAPKKRHTLDEVCKHGHAMVGDNVRWRKKGEGRIRECVACVRRGLRESAARRKQAVAA